MYNGGRRQRYRFYFLLEFYRFYRFKNRRPKLTNAVVVIFTYLRVQALRFVNDPNFSFSSGYLGLLSELRALLAIICCCVPSVCLIFQRWPRRYDNVIAENGMAVGISDVQRGRHSIVENVTENQALGGGVRQDDWTSMAREVAAEDGHHLVAKAQSLQSATCMQDDSLTAFRAADLV